MYMWQSRVEIEGYSITYFNRIAAFKAPYRWTSVKGGAHTCSVDVWISNECMKCIWSPPLTEVQRYGALKAAMRSKYVTGFLHRTATHASTSPSTLLLIHLINQKHTSIHVCIPKLGMEKHKTVQPHSQVPPGFENGVHGILTWHSWGDRRPSSSASSSQTESGCGWEPKTESPSPLCQTEEKSKV